MSLMPTNVAASVLQTAAQQQMVSAVQDAEQNQAAHVVRQANRKAVQRENDVVADESDLTVNTEGGGGGQGRNFTEAKTEENADVNEEDTPGQPRGFTTDAAGRVHVDIEV